MEQNSTDQGKEAKKILAAYEKNIGLLKTINAKGGKNDLTLSFKVPQDELGDLVSEFVKEQKEATIDRVKTGLKKALQTKLDADKAIAEEEKKFAQFKLNKMKEFNQACAELFKELEGIAEMEKSYYESLGSAASATIEAPEEETK